MWQDEAIAHLESVVQLLRKNTPCLEGLGAAVERAQLLKQHILETYPKRDAFKEGLDTVQRFLAPGEERRFGDKRQRKPAKETPRNNS